MSVFFCGFISHSLSKKNNTWVATAIYRKLHWTHHQSWLWLLGLLWRQHVSRLGLAKFSQGSSSVQLWESVGVRLRPIGITAYVPCLLLLCQGSEWLNGKSVWLVFRRSWGLNPSWILDFFPVGLFLTIRGKTALLGSIRHNRTLSWLYLILLHSTMDLYLALLGSTWLHSTLPWLYLALLDSTTLSHGSTLLCFTLLLALLNSTMALLGSSWLYCTLPWLYFALLDSTTLF